MRRVTVKFIPSCFGASTINAPGYRDGASTRYTPGYRDRARDEGCRPGQWDSGQILKTQLPSPPTMKKISHYLSVL